MRALTWTIPKFRDRRGRRKISEKPNNGSKVSTIQDIILRWWLSTCILFLSFKFSRSRQDKICVTPPLCRQIRHTRSSFQEDSKNSQYSRIKFFQRNRAFKITSYNCKSENLQGILREPVDNIIKKTCITLVLLMILSKYPIIYLFERYVHNISYKYIHIHAYSRIQVYLNWTLQTSMCRIYKDKKKVLPRHLSTAH